MSLSPEEKETVIVFNEGGKTAQVYTCTRSVRNKLERFAEQYPNEYKCLDSNEISATYEIPKNRITIRAPKSCIMSEEHKEKLKESLAKYHETNKRNYSTEDIEKAISLYQDMSIKSNDIPSLCGIPSNIIYEELDKRGIPRRTKKSNSIKNKQREITQGDIDNAVMLYTNTKQTTAEITRTTGVSTDIIYQELEKRRLPRRQKGRKR